MFIFQQQKELKSLNDVSESSGKVLTQEAKEEQIKNDQPFFENN